jgi:cytochrome c-type biogenesis protein CcmH/NrfG
MTDPLETARDAIEQQQLDQAVRAARRGIARAPQELRGWELLGQALLRQGDTAAGLDALEHASLLGPITPSSRIELALAHGSLGRKTLSRDLLMQVALGGELSAEQLLRIAAGLEAADEPRLAMEACRRAGRLAPEVAEIHYRMGYYARLCGHRPSVSEALIRHAIDLDPQRLHYRIGLASLLIRLGRQREALAAIGPMIPQRLAEVDCECCLKRLANLFFDFGDLANARRCAQRLGLLRGREASPRTRRHDGATT